MHFMSNPLIAIEPTVSLPESRLWRGQSESLIVADSHRWITPAEKTGLTNTPRYDETIAWLDQLCDESPLVSMIEFGRTAQGRPLYLVIASKEKSPTPDSLRTNGKSTLLIQAGIHSGEIDGKDAGLMLLRDIVVGGKDSLLDRANLLFIPVLNADGHERGSIWNRPNQRGPIEMGWRTTAQNLNLNRDYVKADAPEMRALLAIFERWPIDLYLDSHVTDGLDYQYDICYAYHGRADGPSWSPKIAEWLDRSYSPALEKALRLQGHLPLNFYVNPIDKRNLTIGLKETMMTPRFSSGYGDLRHIPTLLIETHSLKPYRQRVLATYVLFEATLLHLAKEGTALKKSIEADRTHRSDAIALSWVEGGARHAIDFLGFDFEAYHSSASGTREARWLGQSRTYARLPIASDRVGLVAKRPKAYLVPVSKPEVIDKLRLHGIAMQVFQDPQTIEVEMYRVLPRTNKLESHSPMESRFPVSLESLKVERRTETFPSGSVRVSTDQPLGDLAIMMLEPQGADSLFGWGFFNEILHRTEYIEGYVIAPMAEKMLEQDPKLKADFDDKIANEPAFAADPTARLEWFYARTPFYDDRFLLYPVGIERTD